MPLDTASDILGLKDRAEPIVFHVKAWGKEILLRDPSMADRAEWEAYVQENKGKLTAAAGAKMAQIFMCNAAGERLFTPADLDKLNDKRQDAMLQIFNKCIELLSIDEAQVERLEGNSDASR